MEITNLKQIVQKFLTNHKDNLLIFAVIIIGVIMYKSKFWKVGRCIFKQK